MCNVLKRRKKGCGEGVGQRLLEAILSWLVEGEDVGRFVKVVFADVRDRAVSCSLTVVKMGFRKTFGGRFGSWWRSRSEVTGEADHFWTILFFWIKPDRLQRPPPGALQAPLSWVTVALI